MVRNNNLSNEAITRTEYSGFQTAFDFFNVELFDGHLPTLLITLQRKANTRGYFSPKRFAARKAQETVHELALNPDLFEGRTDEEIISFPTHSRSGFPR